MNQNEREKQKDQLWRLIIGLKGNMDIQQMRNVSVGMLFYYCLSVKEEAFLSSIISINKVTFQESWEDDTDRKKLSELLLKGLGYVIEPRFLFSTMVSDIRSGNFTYDVFDEAFESLMGSTKGSVSEVQSR